MDQKVFKGVVDGQSDPRIRKWLIEDCQDGFVVFQYLDNHTRTKMTGSKRDIEDLSKKLAEWGYQEA